MQRRLRHPSLLRRLLQARRRKQGRDRPLTQSSLIAMTGRRGIVTSSAVCRHLASLCVLAEWSPRGRALQCPASPSAPRSSPPATPVRPASPPGNVYTGERPGAVPSADAQEAGGFSPDAARRPHRWSFLIPFVTPPHGARATVQCGPPYRGAAALQSGRNWYCVGNAHDHFLRNSIALGPTPLCTAHCTLHCASLHARHATAAGCRRPLLSLRGDETQVSELLTHDVQRPFGHRRGFRPFRHGGGVAVAE